MKLLSDRGLHALCRPFLLCSSLLVLGSYLPDHNILFFVVPFSIILLILINAIFISVTTKQKIEFVVIGIIFLFSIHYDILLSLFAILLIRFESNKSKIELFFLQVCAIIPIVTVAFESMYQLGLPFGIYFVYFWGIPYILVALLLVYASKCFSFKYVPLAVVVLIFFVVYSTESSSLVFVEAENNSGIVNRKMATAVWEKAEVVMAKDLNQDLSGYTVVVPLVDGVEKPKIEQNNISGRVKLVLFGEHDDMNGFIKNDLKFNANSHRRRSPWFSFSPIMKKDLKYAAKSDYLYCSNIGSTIKENWELFPLVWEYSKFGLPLVLAASSINKNIEIIYFGDSDPIVSYLAPYNLLFLQSLFSINNWCYFFLTAFVCLAVSIISRVDRRYAAIIATIVCFCIIIIQFLYEPRTVSVDVKVHVDGEVLSPHYKHDFGSTPAEIVKKGHSVTMYKNGESSTDVYLLKGRLKKEDTNTSFSKNVIVFMMPGAEFVQDGIIYKSNFLPMGNVMLDLSGERISIVDARTISFENSKGEQFLKLGSVVLVGTGSPQRNAHVYEMLSKTKN